MSLSSKSEMRSADWFSNMNVIASALSSALSVTMSPLLQHLSTLPIEPRLMPSEMFRSHRKWSKPSARSSSATSDTWLESIACSEIPVVEQSKLASVTRSFIASVSFLSTAPSVILASNMLNGCVGGHARGEAVRRRSMRARRGGGAAARPRGSCRCGAPATRARGARDFCAVRLD